MTRTIRDILDETLEIQTNYAFESFIFSRFKSPTLSSSSVTGLFELQRSVRDWTKLQEPVVLEIIGACNPREGTPLFRPDIFRSGDITGGQRVENV
jgi:hypothetical protein